MNKRTLKCWGRPVVQLAVLAALACSAASAGAQSRFRVSADGTETTDTRTGLVWRRCSAGQSGPSCTGRTNTYTHEQALAYARNQAGWRLPNVKELSSILITDGNFFWIDTVAFPGEYSGAYVLGYWTSTPLAGDPGYAWLVLFSSGDGRGVFQDSRSESYHVRLVR